MTNNVKKILHAFQYKGNLIAILALPDGEKHVLINNECLNRDFYHSGSVSDCIGKAICKIDNLSEFYTDEDDHE